MPYRCRHMFLFSVRYVKRCNRRYFNDRTITNFKEHETTTQIIKIASKIGFIGEGNMSKAICKGIVRKGLVEYSQVYVSSPYVHTLESWKTSGANVTTDNGEVAEKADIVVLAVKPHMLHTAVSDIVKSNIPRKLDNKLFVSVLAGVTLETLQEVLSRFKNPRIIRVMPNTPMKVGRGCSVYAPGDNVTVEDVSLVTSIFRSSGFCELVPENMIDAVGALSGSGPAFVYLIIEALADGGVKMGIPRPMANNFAAQTVMGAAKMVLNENKHITILKEEVCSAGGTTIAGIHALEKKGVRGAIMDAVEAATIRAKELGRKG